MMVLGLARKASPLNSLPQHRWTEVILFFCLSIAWDMYCCSSFESFGSQNFSPPSVLPSPASPSSSSCGTCRPWNSSTTFSSAASSLFRLRVTLPSISPTISGSALPNPKALVTCKETLEGSMRMALRVGSRISCPPIVTFCMYSVTFRLLSFPFISRWKALASAFSTCLFFSSTLNASSSLPKRSSSCSALICFIAAARIFSCSCFSSNSRRRKTS
mmetsp:Transcript_21451/g.48371  ORF Transcript_21451/g.48371 Transcript_21451/m.48371 type:complete len:217 (-) Transcript_21451:912-1562(-)